jgi:hypothetical protein
MSKEFMKKYSAFWQSDEGGAFGLPYADQKKAEQDAKKDPEATGVVEAYSLLHVRRAERGESECQMTGQKASLAIFMHDYNCEGPEIYINAEIARDLRDALTSFLDE